MLSVFVALAGVGTALTRTASSVLVARNVDPGRQGVAFGLKHCSIPVGTLLAGLSVPAIALTRRMALGLRRRRRPLDARRSSSIPAPSGRGCRPKPRTAGRTCRCDC